MVFAIYFAFLVAAAIFSLGCEIAMRIRLTRLEVPSEKLLWWRRGGDEVAKAYHELFPASRLPFLRNLVFGVFLGCAAILLVFILLRGR